MNGEPNQLLEVASRLCSFTRASRQPITVTRLINMLNQEGFNLPESQIRTLCGALDLQGHLTRLDAPERYRGGPKVGIPIDRHALAQLLLAQPEAPEPRSPTGC